MKHVGATTGVHSTTEAGHMHDEQASGRSGSRPSRRSRVRLLAFGLAIVTMAVTAASVVAAVNAYADERQAWARDLLRLDNLVTQQRAQDWKTEAGHPPAFLATTSSAGCLAFCATIPEQQQRPIRQMATLLDEATTHDASNPQVLAVRQEFAAYRSDLYNELLLLDQGYVGRMSGLLSGTLDPAADTLHAELEGLEASYASVADQAGRTATVAVYVVLVLVALGLTALLSYLGRARRAHAVLAEVRRSEENFRLLFAGNPQPVLVCDRGSLDLLEVNDAAVRVYGYPRADFLAMNLADLRPDESPREPARSVAGISRHRVRSGRVIDVEVAVQELALGGRPVLVVLTQDVTGRKALADQIRHQALHDSLTSLPNRALFGDHVDRARARSRRSGRPFAVLLLDLDNFKTVNDTFGHAAGDEVLLSVAANLHEHLRSTDTAARLGGDEFAVLLEDVESTEEAMTVARRLSGALEGTMHLTGGQEIAVGASIGVTIGDPAHGEVGELLRRADVAMYWAKQQGRGKAVLFDHPMGAQVVERMETEVALRRGIEAGELEVHYQPVVDVDSGRIRGVEALVRWRHPGRGLLYPAEFIGLAEKTGLIVPLELRVLEEACRQATRWHRDMPTDPPLVVSVNVSAQHLVLPTFVDEVAEILAMTGMEPGSLFLEVTERAAVEGDGIGMRALWRLREIGVRLSIDDFGTGFSSLSYLKRFPGATVLKIDRSFIEGLATSREDAAIAHAIVAMASTVGLRTVAEGVETAEQLRELRRLGCEYAQGYYFARPMPADQLTAMLARGEAIPEAPHPDTVARILAAAS